MTRFRFWLVTLLTWLAIVFNLERIHEPINIASFVYVLAGILAAAIVVVPPMRKATLSVLAAGCISLMVVLKAFLGYEVVGPSLPITVTEATIILITVALSHQIARHTRRFEVTAADVATARWQTRPNTLDAGQTEMYRELRRAREFDRPLSVVALEATSDTLKLSIDRMIEEVRREMIQRYVEVRLTDTLQSEVQDFDLVAHHAGRFILLLPETDGERAEELAARLASRVEQELGLSLRIGTAAFPSDEVTLSGLVERAESSMAEPKPNAGDEVKIAPQNSVLGVS